jgi:hypothetical protein
MHGREEERKGDAKSLPISLPSYFWKKRDEKPQERKRESI